MAALEARMAELEDKLENAEEEPVLIHPEMGRYYREQVTALSIALGDEAYRTEAVAIMVGSTLFRNRTGTNKGTDENWDTSDRQVN